MFDNTSGSSLATRTIGNILPNPNNVTVGKQFRLTVTNFSGKVSGIQPKTRIYLGLNNQTTKDCGGGLNFSGNSSGVFTISEAPNVAEEYKDQISELCIIVFCNAGYKVEFDYEIKEIVE